MTLRVIPRKIKTMCIVASLFVASVTFLISLETPKVKGDPPFSDNVKVNTDSTLTVQNAPTIAVDSTGTAYLAWYDYRNDLYNSDIYFAKSSDWGETWTDPNILVDVGSGNQSNPSIAVDSAGTLYLAWQDDGGVDWDIYFTRSENGGESWAYPPTKISTAGGTQTDPCLKVDSSDNIYVVWEDDRNSNFDIYFAMSTNRGDDWSDPNTKVNRDPASSLQLNPTVAVDAEGTIYVAWEDKITGDFDIHAASSTDGGETWSTSVRVNKDTTVKSQNEPSIGVGPNGDIYLAWQDYRDDNNDIYFAKSTDGGANWTDPNKKINTDTGAASQLSPSLTVSHTGTIYVTWQDKRNGNFDIYFAYSLNYGVTWTDPNLRVCDEDPGVESQKTPTISVGSMGPIHVAWEDRRSGPDDIYSATIDSVHPVPYADMLSVEGYLGPTEGIGHIISHEPTFGFRFKDPHSDPLIRYNVGVWDAFGSTLLWECNRTHSATSGSFVNVIYNTAPYPTNGPPLDDGTTYKLKVAVQNSSGVWSPVSWVDFHMNEVLAPSEPVTPRDESVIEANSSQIVSWNSPNMDSEGDLPQSYNWEVATDSEFTDIIESGSGPVTESGTFDTRPFGFFYWRVNLTDGWETSSYGNQPDGYWIFATFTQSDPNEPQNNPPIITNRESEPSTAIANYTVKFTFTAEDPDTDPLTWGRISGPSWLHIGSDNGTIYGMPLLEDLGPNIFTIQVSDGKGGYDNYTFTIVVGIESQNRPPRITNKESAPTKAKEGIMVNFTFTATDPDSDPLTWSRVSGPIWLQIDPWNGTIYGTPLKDNFGSNVFTIQVTDGKDGFDNCTFTIYVSLAEEEKDTEFPCLIPAILLIFLVLILLLLLLRRRKEEDEKGSKPSKEEPSPIDDGESPLVDGEESMDSGDEEPPPLEDEEPMDSEDEEPPPPDDEEPKDPGD
ncbi:MAG: BNR-4 repeat-containing protein [Thermoplasmata archaeon]|nr:MAG: BNR-4 repeat-containing protein [Thermoplasmata archaeon]